MFSETISRNLPKMDVQPIFWNVDNRLWNGGNGKGTVGLYRDSKLIDEMIAESAFSPILVHCALSISDRHQLPYTAFELSSKRSGSNLQLPDF